MDGSNDPHMDDTPSFLKDIDKKSMDYAVPEGFFDRLQADVLDQMKAAEENTPATTRSIRSFWYKAVAAAAVIAIAIGIGMHQNTDSASSAFTALEEEDLEWYLDNYATDWSSDDVMAMVEEASIDDYADIIPLTTISIEESDISDIIENLDDNTLINYNVE